MYSSAGTANGKVMEVQEVFAIDMTAGGLEKPDCRPNERKNFPHWFDGTKSTVGALQLKSVGKNLFDKSTVNKYTTRPIQVVDGVNVIELAGYDYAKKIEIRGFRLNTQYSVRSNVKRITAHGVLGFYIVYTDGTAQLGPRYDTDDWHQTKNCFTSR